MRYFYCLLFAVSMFMGCSKDSPSNDPNLITAKFSMDSPRGEAATGFYNQFEFFYSKSIDAQIHFKVRFTGRQLDTIFNGEIDKGYTSKPTAFGDPLITNAVSKSFNFISTAPAGKIELISLTCTDPKYKFKVLPPRNITD